MKTWMFIVGGLLLIVIVGSMQNRDTAPSKAADSENVASACAKVTQKEEAAVLEMVYKIDGGYMVYVQPAWYGLKIDEKQTFAAYIARCKLGGSGRFLDSRTGKLLARWGSNGYVNAEQ